MGAIVLESAAIEERCEIGMPLTSAVTVQDLDAMAKCAASGCNMLNVAAAVYKAIVDDKILQTTETGIRYSESWYTRNMSFCCTYIRYELAIRDSAMVYEYVETRDNGMLMYTEIIFDRRTRLAIREGLAIRNGYMLTNLCLISCSQCI